MALEPVVFGLARWGAEWMFGDPLPNELDAQLLVWWMHSRVDTSGLVGERHVLHLRFADDARRFWIVVEHGTPSVCMSDPGFPVDVTISSDVASLYAVWLGRLPSVGASVGPRPGGRGHRRHAARLDEVLRLSPVAPFVAAGARDAGLSGGGRCARGARGGPPRDSGGAPSRPRAAPMAAVGDDDGGEVVGKALVGGDRRDGVETPGSPLSRPALRSTR